MRCHQHARIRETAPPNVHQGAAPEQRAHLLLPTIREVEDRRWEGFRERDADDFPVTDAGCVIGDRTERR
jgi:hypothetical protein